MSQKFNEVMASWSDANSSNVEAFHERAAATRSRLDSLGQRRAAAMAQGDHQEVERVDNTRAALVQAVKQIEAGDESRAPARAITHSTVFRSHKQAFDCGQWFRARFTGSADAQAYCLRNGIIQAAMVTGDNTAGGFLVPEPLENAIIELREQYGQFRQNCTNVTMGDAVMNLPRVAGEITSYYVGENATITASDMSLNSIKLEARKLACLTTMSSELSEDSVASIADMLARSIAYSFALKEDQAGFLGDGTSTYGGIVGLSGALAAGSKTTATSRTTFSALLMSDFETVIGSAKMYGPNRKWYISNAGYFNSMQRLMDAVGGNNVTTIANGNEQQRFLGYPVAISQVLESRTSGTSGQVACYFGDLQAGAYLGTRRGISIALDSSRYFEQDALALRATQRFDIVVHDRGDANNSGGLVALVFG